MNINELKKLIKAGDVEKITFFKENESWGICAYGKPSVYVFENTLSNSSRDYAVKTYTSLDRAYSAMKKLGYKNRFEIDDS